MFVPKADIHLLHDHSLNNHGTKSRKLNVFFASVNLINGNKLKCEVALLNYNVFVN
jgi:hypothetical protein